MPPRAPLTNEFFPFDLSSLPIATPPEAGNISFRWSKMTRCMLEEVISLPRLSGLGRLWPFETVQHQPSAGTGRWIILGTRRHLGSPEPPMTPTAKGPPPSLIFAKERCSLALEPRSGISGSPQAICLPDSPANPTALCMLPSL